MNFWPGHSFVSQALVTVNLMLPLAAQGGVIVDQNNGPYRTITAALAVTTGTDIIRVKKGVYVEDIVLSGRAANIVSIAALPTDVELRGTSPAKTALTIRFHPANATSRFARMVIDNGQPLTSGVDGVTTQSSAGHLVFEEIRSNSRWSLSSHRGTISLTRCWINPSRVGNYQLKISGVERAFLNQCFLSPGYTNSYWFGPSIYPGTVVENSNVEFSRCNMRGCHYGSYTILYSPGGPALTVTDSNCRITGLSNDAILGGNGHQTSITYRNTQGGSGIVALRSTLTISGATIKAGAGVNSFNQPAPDIHNTSSIINRPTTALPVVYNPNGFTRGGVETLYLIGPASAASLTWIALDFKPFMTPFGYLLLDPLGPVLLMPAGLDASGRATHSLDLRTLPPTFTGAPYIVQTITQAPNGIIGLSSPQNGVIASR